MKQVPRKKAIQALALVLADKNYLDSVLERLMGSDEFENAWLKDVVSGVLRWKGRIDYFIDELAHHKKPSGKLRRALQVACYQILEHTEVHPIQVIDETVEWIKQEEGRPPAGFANVLLRKLYESKQAILDLDCDSSAPLAHKCAVTSLPEWILKPLEQEQGWLATQAWAKQALKVPKTWVCDFDPTQEFKPTLWQSDSKTLRRKLSDEKLYVQDLSSQTLVHLVSKYLKVGSRVLDYCAAPGGKSFGLARLGYSVTASDLSRDRLNILETNQKRLGVTLDQILEQKDLNSSSQKFDAVWIDAPCSGSGTIQKNPDLKWNRTEKDLSALLEEQKKCFSQAALFLKPGGLLIYSVCSVIPLEGKRASLEVKSRKFDLVEELELGFHQADSEGFYARVLREVL